MMGSGRENKQEFIAYLCYALAWLVLHSVCKRCGDDLVWLDFAQNPSFERIYNHYISYMSTWSSRIVIDLIGIIVEVLPMIVWRLLDTLAIVFLTFQIDRMINVKKNIRISFFIMCMCFIYPFIHMVSAGWMATTFTYLWPLSCSAYVGRILKMEIENEEVIRGKYVVALFLFIYAIDNQQVAVFMTVICFGVALIIWLKHGKSKFTNNMLVLGILRVILHLVWPGSSSRMAAETKTWFPDYGMLGLVDKLQIGVSSICDIVFMDDSLVFLLMSCIMTTVVYVKSKDWVHRIISLVPTVVMLIFGPFRRMAEMYFPKLFLLENGYSNSYGFVNNMNYFKLSSYISLFVFCFALICMFVSLLVIFECSQMSILYCTVFLAGIGSRAMMGLSPTVVASGTRTYIYLYFVAIFITIVMMKKLVELCEKRANLWMMISYTLGVLSYINSVGQVRFAG